MRRLLVFGTGAALIGLVLLVVAFYEAYLIVSTLQKEVGTVTNTNLLLEDATLEAVFLGVMAALGYGLVAKGLDGIRRQELLEMESAADVTYGRGPLSAQAAQEQHRVDIHPSQAKASATDSHPGIRHTEVAPMGLVSPAKPKEVVPSAEDKKLAPVWGPPAAPLQEPQAASSAGQVSEGAQTPVRAEGSADVQTQSMAPQEAASKGEAGTSPTPAGPSPQDTRPGQVVWEGGAPPRLQGVEVLPEPAVQGPEAATAVSPSSNEPYSQASSGSGSMTESAPQETGAPQIDPVTGLPFKPKRGRGRPKGSKSAKKVAEATSDAPPQP